MFSASSVQVNPLKARYRRQCCLNGVYHWQPPTPFSGTCQTQELFIKAKITCLFPIVLHQPFADRAARYSLKDILGQVRARLVPGDIAQFKLYETLAGFLP